MQQDFMKTKPILPLVLSMSLPMMLSMLVNSLYNIIDSMFVAKLGEDCPDGSILDLSFTDPCDKCGCRLWRGH